MCFKIYEIRARLCTAMFGAIVDPDRFHADRLCRLQVAGHILDEQRPTRLDIQRAAHVLIRIGMRLGPVPGTVDIEQTVKRVSQAKAGQNPPGIVGIAICEDEFATGKLCQRRIEHRIGCKTSHVDIVHEIEEVVRVEEERTRLLAAGAK